MGKCNGSREWSKEEMMAYLDWNKAEDRRVQDRVDTLVERDGVFNNRRGLAVIGRGLGRLASGSLGHKRAYKPGQCTGHLIRYIEDT